MILKYITLFLLSMGFAVQSSPLPTLADHISYIQDVPEFIAIKEGDLFHPDYEEFYFSKVGSKTLSRGTSPMASIDYKKQCLHQLFPMVLTGPFLEKNQILNLKTSEHDQFYVWTDLVGAYHSLVRSLAYLKQNGVIDESLKIIDPKVYFIVQGNHLGLSAYNVEMSILLLQLAARNPKHVILVRSQQENHHGWLDAGMGDQLRSYFSTRYISQTLFTAEFEQFFQSLPVGLILNEPKGQNFIYVASRDYPYEPHFFKGSEAGKERFPHVVMQTVDRVITYAQPQGLELLPQAYGATVWNVFSGLTLAYRQHYGFNKDAFAAITLGQDLRTSHISLSSQEWGQKGFQKQSYHLVSGRPLGQNEKILDPFTKEDLRIVATMDLTESSAVLGQRLLRGVDLKLRQQNQNGGILGQRISIFYYNDLYDPSRTVQFLVRAMKRDPFSIVLAPLGTPTVKALKSFMETHDVVTLFPYTGANLFRTPKNFIHYRASYIDEVTALVTYAKEKLFKQKFGFFYQNDDFGLSLVGPAKKILTEKYHLSSEAYCEASYTRNSLQVDDAVKKIHECSPDVLFLFSTYPPARELINQLGIMGIYNIPLMGISFLSDRFRDYVAGQNSLKKDGKGLTVVMSKVIPNPDTDSSQMVQEYRQAMQKNYPGVRFDSESLEGYIDANLLLLLLKNLKQPLSPHRILEAAKTLGNTTFKGLTLNYDPEKSTFSKDVWLDLGEKEWLYFPGT